MAVVVSVCKGAVIGNEELMGLGGRESRGEVQKLDSLFFGVLPNKKISKWVKLNIKPHTNSV